MVEVLWIRDLTPPILWITLAAIEFSNGAALKEGSIQLINFVVIYCKAYLDKNFWP